MTESDAKIIDFQYFRQRKSRRASEAVDVEAEEAVDVEAEDADADEEVFAVTFMGKPDEIYDQAVGWLRSEPDNIGDVVTVRSGGFLTFEDDPDDEASDRYSDVIWQETFPLWGEDDPEGEPSELFDAEVLLRLILKHPQPFKALLAADNASVCEVADESKNAFLVDFYRY